MNVRAIAACPIGDVVRTIARATTLRRCRDRCTTHVVMTVAHVRGAGGGTHARAAP